LSEAKKNASAKGEKAMDKDKEEVLENIMEELEQEAKDKEKKETEEPSKEDGEQETAAKEDISEEKESEDSKEEDKKKGLFNKKEKKNPLQEKVDELNDKVLRQMAEFENFRKRTDKEKAQQFELGQSNILEKLLPIVDNFERGLAAVPEAEKDGAFADGMNKIYKQLVTELENLGVTPIEAVGKEFDPNFHNAVMQVESEEYGSGIVAQELQKGYMFHDTVLRHSMVGVTP
jgi:molecular chaperone GrpE